MRRTFAITGLVASMLLPLFAHAQVADSVVQATISGPDEVAVGRTIVLDASRSKTASGSVSYAWYQDQFPQPISRAVEALFTPETPGEYVVRLVVRQEIDGQVFESETSKTITAYARKIVLIADGGLPPEKLALHQQTAMNADVFLQVLTPPAATIPLGLEEALTQLLSDDFDRLDNADAIVFWVDDEVAGMQALMRAARGSENRLQLVQNLSVVVISDGSLNTLARAVRGPFSVLEPQRLLITRKEAINPLLEAETMQSFEEVLKTRDIEFIAQDPSSLSLRPWNVLAALVTYMLTHGISSQTVILLLMLPVIATILAFLKQVIGITTFGLYTPSIIALSFLALGWPIGIVFLIFILLSGYIARKVMRRWKLLYIPKIAIILTVVSITLLAAIALGTSLGIVLAPDTIFVLLIMSTLSESFLTLEGAEGRYAALYGIIETVLAALLCVFIVRWPALQSFVLAYPESILLTVGLNILFGRYTGLRVVEYFRFREVFKQIQEE